MIGIILQKLLCKFHQDPTSQTLSILHLSSKSLPGVLEDVEVPDDPGGGVICQDSNCPSSLFLESWRTWRFLMNLEVVSYDRDHTSEASVKV